jgi:hypothetical protein
MLNTSKPRPGHGASRAVDVTSHSQIASIAVIINRFAIENCQFFMPLIVKETASLRGLQIRDGFAFSPAGRV